MKKKKAIFKFNNANPVILCSKCSKIIKYIKDFTEDEKLAIKGRKYLEPQYCDSCKLEDKIYNYPTKFEEGFTFNEIKKLLEDYPGISMKHFDSAMRGNTCMMKVEDDKPVIVNYHCDVYKAIVCGLEARELTSEEFD